MSSEGFSITKWFFGIVGSIISGLAIWWLTSSQNGPSPPIQQATPYLKGTPKAAPETLLADATSRHLGDEKIKNWARLHGQCFSMPFSADGTENQLTLQLEVFGAENVSIRTNGKIIQYLPAQRVTGNAIRPNYWSTPITVEIPTTNLRRGGNRVEICAESVSNPEFVGDVDDFQIRNVLLKAIRS